jgi:hypothetical protein
LDIFRTLNWERAKSLMARVSSSMEEISLTSEDA